MLRIFTEGDYDESYVSDIYSINQDNDVPLAMVKHQSLIQLDKQPLESIITALQLAVGLLLLGKGLIGTQWSITRLTLILIAIVIMFGFNLSNYF